MQDDTAIGNRAIQSLRGSGSNYSYNSSYSFPNVYSIAISETSGDTDVSSISLTGTSGTLFKETVNRYKVSGTRYHEKQYIMDIGNVELKRSSGSDSIGRGKYL